MMAPAFNKFFNLFMKFGRNGNYFLSTFKRESKIVYRMLFSSLASFTGWLPTETAGKTKAAFHNIWELSKNTFFTNRYIQIYSLYYVSNAEYIAEDMCLSRGLEKFLNNSFNFAEK